MKQILLINTLAILLCGCEGTSTYFTEIHNLSSSNLTIYYQQNIQAESDNLILGRGTIDKKEQFSKLGGISENQRCNSWYNDVLIINQNSDTCKIDFQNLDNWSSFTKRTAKMPGSYEHTCSIIITDADF